MGVALKAVILCVVALSHANGLRKRLRRAADGVATGDPNVQDVPPGHRMTMAGHRGSSYSAPENTLAAIRLAFEQGADGVEFDVLLSADGEVFLTHDAKMKRASSICPPELCNSGMTQAQYSQQLSQDVSTLNYQTFLQYLDVGSWKGAQYADQRPPTLRQAVAEIPDGKYALCELKDSNSELGRIVVDTAVAEGWPANKFRIIGFSLDLMTEVKQRFVAEGQVHTVLYLKSASGESAAQDAIRSARSRGLDGVDFKALPDAITSPVVGLAHAAGEEIGVWVSSSSSGIDNVKNAGLMDRREIDFFTTDFVPEVAEWTPGRDQPVRCKEGDRIVGQWGGNDLWYSGLIKKVRSPTHADIIADDDNEDSNWENVWPTRVLKSSDDGSQKMWCWRASSVNNVPDTYDVSMCTEFILPEVRCGQGDRIVAQWGGTSLWYSGVILFVHSSTSVDIMTDDGNMEGWDNAGLGRVLKSSDDGSNKEWAWRAGDIADVPRTFDTGMCTEFVPQPALPRVTCKGGDRIVGQWGGNGLWYSGIISRVRSPTSCDILADDNSEEWQSVRPTRVLKSSDIGSQRQWCWRAVNIASIPKEYDISYCTEFIL